MKKEDKKIAVLEKLLLSEGFALAINVEPADEKEAVSNGLRAMAESANFEPPVCGVVYRLPNENGRIRVGFISIGNSDEEVVHNMIVVNAIFAGFRVVDRSEELLFLN